MSLQDGLAILTLAFAIAGVVFALGKQAQSLATIGFDVNQIGKKLDVLGERTDRRLDDTAKFIVRVDQRVANLERQVYGDQITEILRTGSGFARSEDDTIPL